MRVALELGEAEADVTELLVLPRDLPQVRVDARVEGIGKGWLAHAGPIGPGAPPVAKKSLDLLPGENTSEPVAGGGADGAWIPGYADSPMRRRQTWLPVAVAVLAMAFALPAAGQKPKGKGKAPKEAAAADPETPETKPADDKSREKKAAPDKKVAASKQGDGPAVVKVEKEKEEGVKTYTFGAVEVEGRLKSPQIIYFLRRVRAEFNTGALGHRSFLRELSDTRRSPALR